MGEVVRCGFGFINNIEDRVIFNFVSIVCVLVNGRLEEFGFLFSDEVIVIV